MIPEYLTTFAHEHGIAAGETAARFLKHWEAHAGSQPASMALMASFRDVLAGSEYAPASRNRIMGTVGAYLKWLRRHGGAQISRDDIMDAFQQFKVEDKLPQVMTPAQIRRLLAYLATAPNRRANEHRIYTLFRLLMGARHEEVISLTPASVQWETRQVVVDGRKTKRERSVGLDNSPALRRMIGHLCRIANRPFLCRSVSRASIAAMFAASGLPDFQRRVFRSTCAAYAASSGCLNEYQLGSWFGHSTQVAIKHYRQPIHGITGVNIEQWLGCEAEANLCVDAVVAYAPRGLVLRA